MQNEKNSYRAAREGSHSYKGEKTPQNDLRHRNQLFGIPTSKQLNW